MALNHKQALDLLNSRSLVTSIEQDLTRLIRRGISASPGGSDEVTAQILRNILSRWNCALFAPDDEVTPSQKNLTIVVLTLLLHKYGFQEQSLTSKAHQAIDSINNDILLDDQFFRKTSDLKELLSSPPVLRSRKPTRPADVTFWRAGDLATYQVGETFYALYIHGLVGVKEAPIVEFFDIALSRRPAQGDILGQKMRGVSFNDGVIRAQRYIVFGMRDMPDPANQFHLLGNVPHFKPDHTQLAPSIGIGVVTDIFRLADEVREKLFTEE